MSTAVAPGHTLHGTNLDDDCEWAVVEHVVEKINPTDPEHVNHGQYVAIRKEATTITIGQQFVLKDREGRIRPGGEKACKYTRTMDKSPEGFPVFRQEA